jgi:S-DNA-T family DNA segregation ATPase FtsK/SpoIIIE
VLLLKLLIIGYDAPHQARVARPGADEFAPGVPIMADRRGARVDLFAWGLLLAGLMVALCVFSHEHAAGTMLSTPASSNLLGVPGAWLAQDLFDLFGSAVYIFLASWFVLVLLLLQRKCLRAWSLRLAGWLVLIPCTAAAADFLGSPFLGGPVTGSGGSLGALVTAWLDDQLSPIPAGILFGTVLLASLYLAVDFAVVRAFRAVRVILKQSREVLRRIGSIIARATSIITKKKIHEDRPPLIIRKTGLSAASEDADDIPIHHSTGDKVEAEENAPVAKPNLALFPPPIRRPAPVEEEDRFDDYELPPLSLLEEPEPFPYQEHDQKLRETAVLLEKTFKDFDLNVRVVGINTGPVITQYEVALETGLRVHKVTGLADDLALNLKVPSVRVVAPIPGKNTVGIEIPNEHRAVVRLKECLTTAGRKANKCKIPLFLGKDTEGRPLVYDLAEMPHLLIAGRTGTGKSVCMNAIILSMLMTRRPDEVKMVMIDPKMLELSEYGKIPHLMHPVVKDMKKAEAILAWAVDKMEERYDLLSRARVRSIAAYNDLSIEEIHKRVQPDEDEVKRIPEKMPYIVIFVDEMNDLLMVMKREVEGHIIRLAQKSRAAGIHLVVATQKPTVDVITGLIKSNLPARICFQVSSRSDSRVVLDEMGADKLLGKGDMLFLQPGTSTIIRAQGTYSSDEEITRVVQHLECEPCYVQELVQLKPGGEGGTLGERLRARDDMYEAAVEVVIREGRGSVSLLQRSLGIGYGRAARLIDFMAEDGIVGGYNGSNAREVLYTPEAWEQLKQNGSMAS